MRVRKPSPGTVIALAAMLVALGEDGYEAIPRSNGTINACYQQGNGSLRVVDLPSDCRNSERSLAWSQSGGGFNNVVARARSTQSVTTTSTPVVFLTDSNMQGVPVPMSGNTWTQRAADVD